MDFTADALVSLTRELAFLPDYDEGEDARLLNLLNRGQLDYLQGVLQSAGETFRLATHTIPIVDGVLSYAIPRRAMAAGVELLQFQDEGGLVWMATEFRPRDWARRGVFVAPGRQFYLEGNSIKFYAQPSPGSIVVYYPRRLSELVLSTDTACRTISAINTSTKTLTLSGIFTSSSGLCDLVQAQPQFSMLSMEASFTGSGAPTLVFADALPDGLAVGDYVCTPSKAPVCLAPLEMHQLLCQHVAYVTLQAKGDQRAGNTLELRNDTKGRVLSLLEPRPTKPRSIVNRNAPGFWGPFGYGWNWRGW